MNGAGFMRCRGSPRLSFASAVAVRRHRSLHARWVGIVQVLPDGRDVVQSSGFQPLDYIAACQHDYRVSVFADFLVSLGVEVGGGDKDAELAVPKPRDETACLSYADTVGGCVALGFQGEVDGNGVRMGAEQVLPNGISAAIAPRAGDIDLVDVGLADSRQVGGELLKVMWRSLKC
jgi:hypothetical protein